MTKVTGTPSSSAADRSSALRSACSWRWVRVLERGRGTGQRERRPRGHVRDQQPAVLPPREAERVGRRAHRRVVPSTPTTIVRPDAGSGPNRSTAGS